MERRAMPNRRGLCAIGLAFLSAILTACAGSPPSPTPTAAQPSQALLGPFSTDVVEGLRTAVDVFYTDVTECGGKPCRVPLDVIAPLDADNLPTIVLFNGGGKLFPERRYQAALAVELAKRGAVVFLTAYRGIKTANSDQDSISDARCATRYARAHAAEYGGDPDRLLVVGHSQGALLGVQIAIQPDQEAEACLADGSAVPDGVVGLGSPRPSFNGAGDSGPPIWLYSGSLDPVSNADASAQILRDHGFDATGEEFEGVSHDGITDPAAAPEVVDLIMQALSSI